MGVHYEDSLGVSLQRKEDKSGAFMVVGKAYFIIG